MAKAMPHIAFIRPARYIVSADLDVLTKAVVFGSMSAPSRGWFLSDTCYVFVRARVS